MKLLSGKKIKFALTSIVATIIDHSLFLILVHAGSMPSMANFSSQLVGMIVNFVLQRRFVFSLKRRISVAFILSFLFSIAGLLFGTFLVELFCSIPFFANYPYLAKLIVTIIVFFYNFYSKRVAFEKY